MSASRLVFSWSESDTVHKLFQVEQDADGMWVCSRVLATFIPPGGDWLLTSCVEALKQKGWAWVPPDSNLLRKAFDHHLRTVPPESIAATPSEAFSGERIEP